MKTVTKPLKWICAIFLMSLLAGWVAPQRAKADVSLSFFYDSLDPYGDWIEVGDYGYCWKPRVEHGWRPYSDGYWTYTDYGWTWVSYEDYGWATYHYGRWAELEDEGWVWVPGYQWGPAWVSWRRSDDYVGWAPLPPETRVHGRGGVSVSFSFGSSVDYDYDIGPGCFNFVAVRDFGSPVLRPVLVDRSENITIVNKTVNVTNVVVNKNKNVVYNYGPDYNFMAARSAKPIKKMAIVRNTNVSASNTAAFRTKTEGDKLVVPAPVVAPTKEKIKPPKVAQHLAQPKVAGGWADVKDPAEHKRIKQEMKEQRQAAKQGAEGQQTEVQPGVSPTGTETLPGDKHGQRKREAAAAGQPVQPGETAVTPGPGMAEGKGKRGGKGGKGQAGNLQPFTGEQAVTPAETPAVTEERGQKGGKGLRKQQQLQQQQAQEEAVQAQQEKARGKREQQQQQAAAEQQRKQEARQEREAAQRAAAQREQAAAAQQREARRQQAQEQQQLQQQQAERRQEREQMQMQQQRQMRQQAGQENARREAAREQQMQRQQAIQQQQRMQGGQGQGQGQGQGGGRGEGKKHKHQDEEVQPQ